MTSNTGDEMDLTTYSPDGTVTRTNTNPPKAFTFDAEVTPSKEFPGSFNVAPVCTSHVTDRGCAFSWLASEKHVARLSAAIRAQKAIKNPSIKTDIGGKTYVSFDIEVIGRRMNADLKRLGF